MAYTPPITKNILEQAAAMLQKNAQPPSSTIPRPIPNLFGVPWQQVGLGAMELNNLDDQKGLLGQLGNIKPPQEENADPRQLGIVGGLGILAKLLGAKDRDVAEGINAATGQIDEARKRKFNNAKEKNEQERFKIQTELEKKRIDLEGIKTKQSTLQRQQELQWSREEKAQRAAEKAAESFADDQWGAVERAMSAGDFDGAERVIRSNPLLMRRIGGDVAGYLEGRREKAGYDAYEKIRNSYSIELNKPLPMSPSFYKQKLDIYNTQASKNGWPQIDVDAFISNYRNQWGDKMVGAKVKEADANLSKNIAFLMSANQGMTSVGKKDMLAQVSALAKEIHSQFGAELGLSEEDVVAKIMARIPNIESLPGKTASRIEHEIDNALAREREARLNRPKKGDKPPVDLVDKADKEFYAAAYKEAQKNLGTANSWMDNYGTGDPNDPRNPAYLKWWKDVGMQRYKDRLDPATGVYKGLYDREVMQDWRNDRNTAIVQRQQSAKRISEYQARLRELQEQPPAQSGGSTGPVKGKDGIWRPGNPNPSGGTGNTLQVSKPRGAANMQELIRGRFVEKHGVTEERVLQAILANAYAESGFRADARANTATEDSVGLFQLNRKGGMGAGKSVEQLSDPIYNIDAIGTSGHFKKFMEYAKANPKMSARDLAYHFARIVERPAAKHLPARKLAWDKLFGNTRRMV